jgi:anterior pharynx defective protein 1
VVGLGFGMMSGAFSLVNVLADSVGPGTVGFHNEPQDFFMVSSLLCMPMIFLHTFWGVITFDALDRRRWLNLAYVWASHFLVSCLVRHNNIIALFLFASVAGPALMIALLFLLLLALFIL